MEWSLLIRRMLFETAELLETCRVWLPDGWRGWLVEVERHFEVLHEHERELLFEVVGSLR